MHRADVTLCFKQWHHWWRHCGRNTRTTETTRAYEHTYIHIQRDAVAACRPYRTWKLAFVSGFWGLCPRPPPDSAPEHHWVTFVHQKPSFVLPPLENPQLRWWTEKLTEIKWRSRRNLEKIEKHFAAMKHWRWNSRLDSYLIGRQSGWTQAEFSVTLSCKQCHHCWRNTQPSEKTRAYKRIYADTHTHTDRHSAVYKGDRAACPPSCSWKLAFVSLQTPTGVLPLVPQTPSFVALLVYS